MDHSGVCDQCRMRKVRCGREKPQCYNCVRLGHDCEWSGQGKKPNQTVLLSHAIVNLSNKVQELEETISHIQSSLRSLSGSPHASYPGIQALSDTYSMRAEKTQQPLKREARYRRRTMSSRASSQGGFPHGFQSEFNSRGSSETSGRSSPVPNPTCYDLLSSQQVSNRSLRPGSLLVDSEGQLRQNFDQVLQQMSESDEGRAHLATILTQLVFKSSSTSGDSSPKPSYPAESPNGTNQPESVSASIPPFDQTLNTTMPPAMLTHVAPNMSDKHSSENSCDQVEAYIQQNRVLAKQFGMPQYPAEGVFSNDGLGQQWTYSDCDEMLLMQEDNWHARQQAE